MRRNRDVFCLVQKNGMTKDLERELEAGDVWYQNICIIIVSGWSFENNQFGGGGRDRKARKKGMTICK